MEFWGVEVKSGEPLKVLPGDGMILHLSQASLGELKKEKVADSICLFVNVDGKKLVLGTLLTDKLPQQQFDLVFDKDFELSHNWKSGSVYFYGYMASNPFSDDEFPEGESDESEDELADTILPNGKSEPLVKKEKPAVAEKAVDVKEKESKDGKQRVKIAEPPKGVNPLLDVESSDDDLMYEDEDHDGDDDSKDDDDEDDSDDDSDERDKETPKKVETSKKRAAESATKTPLPDKKAKVTPQKTDGKKGGVHVATPYPVKQAVKAAAPANKPQQTPKSGGSSSCKRCSKTFGSEKALESHTKAKHSAGK